MCVISQAVSVLLLSALVTSIVQQSTFIYFFYCKGLFFLRLIYQILIMLCLNLFRLHEVRLREAQWQLTHTC